MAIHGTHLSLYSGSTDIGAFGSYGLSHYRNCDFFPDSGFKIYNRMHDPYPEIRFWGGSQMSHHHCHCGDGLLGGLLGSFAYGFFGSLFGLVNNIFSCSFMSMGGFGSWGRYSMGMGDMSNSFNFYGQANVTKKDGSDKKDGKPTVITKYVEKYVDRTIQDDDDLFTITEKLNAKGKEAIDPSKTSDAEFNIFITKLLANDDAADRKRTARAVLTRLGIIDSDARSTRPTEVSGNSTDYLCGKPYNNYRILKLLEIADVAVELVYNSNAHDKWIVGPISNVKLEDDKLSFECDCKETGVLYNGRYKMIAKEQNSDTFKVYKMDDKKGNMDQGREVKIEGHRLLDDNEEPMRRGQEENKESD